jgi:glycosyltransferase involved in cell wall biosynthesis
VSADTPAVTVVIPTFRRPDMVVRAIRSVLNQTHPHVRVRVFDNASGDGTACAVGDLARADPRVEYAVHAQNIGAAANFAHAISQVDTPLFVVLSDDDVLLPTFLETGVAMLRKHPEAWFHCAPSLVFNELAGGVRIHGASWEPGLHAGGAASAERMLHEHFITTGVLFRSDVRSTVGDFAEYPLEREFVAHCAALHSFTVTDAIGGVLVVHERSFTAGLKEKRTDRDRIVGVRYARECLFSALARIVPIPSFDPAERARIFCAVMENGRKDTLYHLGFKALPTGAWDQIDDVLMLGKWLGFGAPARVALRALRVVAFIPLLSDLLMLVARVAARRITRTAYEPFETTEHREIVEYVRSGAHTA